MGSTVDKAIKFKKSDVDDLSVCRRICCSDADDHKKN